MAEQDSLRTFEFPKKEGLFVRLSADSSPRKLRILTTDPMVSVDKFANTRFGFIVWDYNEGKARILNATPGLARRIQELHQDEDFGANIKKIDVKIVTTGSGMETRHTITALPKAETLTNAQIEECAAINLEEKIEGGQRMTFYKPENFESKTIDADDIPMPSDEDAPLSIEDAEPINLDDIPF